jgi:hypothetical protein
MGGGWQGGYPAVTGVAIVIGSVESFRASLLERVGRYHGAGEGRDFLLSEYGMHRVESAASIPGFRAASEVRRA